ncbi:uncharacterized protein LOC108485042 [Gossypium arboreum]|uniref:uncharacterized protein LOC108485042 n=1 Tax=Gossypium arboreum TaxID=29729 RepID=UPI0008194CA2|nr:uncharacterized protein LOC108485042 [Gossypium arboreum]
MVEAVGGSAESSSLGKSQAMLRILERVARPYSRSEGCVTGVIPTMAEYWLEATERIMNSIDCTPKQRLKGAISLLWDKAYQWWLLVEKGTQPDRLNWNFFKTAFQGKYVGASYVDARRREFMNLTQGDRSVVLRLSRYARGMVASEYEKCVHFEDGLRDNLRVLISLQREREFAVLVDKAKIAEKVKHVER